MAGIKETLEVIALGASAAQAFKGANADGKIDISDLGQLMTLVPAVGPALGNIDQVPSELKDLDEQELAEIKSKVVSIVGEVGDEKAIAIAEAALTAGHGIYQLVTALKSEG